MQPRYLPIENLPTLDDRFCFLVRIQLPNLPTISLHVLSMKHTKSNRIQIYCHKFFLLGVSPFLEGTRKGRK